MAHEFLCPCCGARIGVGSDGGESGQVRTGHERTVEAYVPATVAEDDFGYVAAGQVDPLVVSAPASAQPILSDAAADLLATPDPDCPAGPAPDHGGSPRSSGDTIAQLNLELGELPTRPGPGPRPHLPGFPVDLAADSIIVPPEADDAAATPFGDAAPVRQADGNQAQGRLSSRAPRRTGLGRVLLISYASAMTIACLWLVWLLRSRESEAPAAPPEQPRALRRLGSGDAYVGPRLHAPPRSPITADRTTRLHQPLPIGAIELVPLEVRSTSVTLERLDPDGRRSVRDGGGGVLVLRLRLRNTSEDQVFAPLDEALLRIADQRLPECFIETGEGRIDAYPLSAGSEWGIVGQEFRELKPGEVVETFVASDEGALARAADAMTWRLRLRTGPAEESVDVVAVQFRRDQIN